jgi:hypothetical protein
LRNARPTRPPIFLSLAIIVGLMLSGGLVGLAFRKHAPKAVAAPEARAAAESVAPPIDPPPPSDSASPPPVVDIDDLPAAAKPARSGPARKPKTKSGCEPPYSIDANGRKHYKPECLP